ncbi:MAG: glutathione S-transferase N-terminal domain-containing protein [Agarilytica sp.]
MFVVRWLLGKIILLLDWVFTPKGIERSADGQAQVDAQTAKLALYQYLACPFCVKVRRAMKRNSLNIETRDAKRCESHREELVKGGGNLKVPCLRIEEQDGEVVWLYESSDIINYLERSLLPQVA